MLYAVIQNELKALDPLSVTGVYADVFKLNKIDARSKVIKRTKGIIAFGLEEFVADQLVYRLMELNYNCRKLPIENIQPLPDTMSIYNARFADEGIFFENLFGEQSRLLWNHLQMIEVFRVHNRSISVKNRKKAKRVGKPSTVTIKKEAVKEGRFIEIYSDSPYPRLQIEASRFNYSCLGDQMNSDSQCNFEQLLNRISSFTDRYGVSFTNSSIQQSYPSVKAFEVYSHWKLQQLELG